MRARAAAVHFLQGARWCDVVVQAREGVDLDEVRAQVLHDEVVRPPDLVSRRIHLVPRVRVAGAGLGHLGPDQRVLLTVVFYHIAKDLLVLRDARQTE